MAILVTRSMRVKRTSTAIWSRSANLRIALVGLVAATWTANPAIAQNRTDTPASSLPTAAAGPKAKGQDSVTAAPPSTTAPDPANEAAIETRVRELIYVLRLHRVFERTDEWGAAIRELVEIGPPALPELLLELKNSERNATIRGLLFTLRAIDAPRALTIVVEALPKAKRLSGSGSDCGVQFANPELQKFMKQHENYQDTSDSVSYGRPINEIMSTLHKLARQPLPDLTKQVPRSWTVGHWQDWWNKPGRSKLAEIHLPSRKEDLVERDGVRRFGPLFPVGPDQRLGAVVDVTLVNSACADALSCLDLETGRLYENLEGLHYGLGETYGRLDSLKWQLKHGIDLTAHDCPDMHIWLVENDRWDALNSEVRSKSPFDVGREAAFLTPFDKSPTDLKPDRVGTFLFTTREGSRGALRVYPMEQGSPSRRLSYRFWNRDAVKPHTGLDRLPRGKGEWQPAKIVILKEPGFDKQCLYDFEKATIDVLPSSISSPGPLPDIEALLKRGGILRNDRIAAWARERGIDLATSRSGVGFGSPPSDDVLKNLHNGQIAQLMLLDARDALVTAEAFSSLTLAHAKDILARNPSSFQLTHMSPPLSANASPATYLFETKSGLIGLLQILKVGERLSSISFRYELAHTPVKPSADQQ